MPRYIWTIMILALWQCSVRMREVAGMFGKRHFGYYDGLSEAGKRCFKYFLEVIL